MTCGPEPVTFRILDTHSVWTLDLHPTSSAVTVGTTIELAQIDPAAVDPITLAGVMPPPWIAHGCEPCDWYLACKPTVLRFAPRILDCKAPDPDPCATPPEADPSCLGWVPIAGAGCQIELVDPVAVAATRGHVAVLDAGRRELLVLTAGGEHVLRSFPTRARGPIAFWRTSVVVADGAELIAFDLTTGDARSLAKAEGPIARMVAAGSVLWIAVAAPGTVHLFHLRGCDLIRGTLAELAEQARLTMLAAATDDVACLLIPRGGGEPRTSCIDRCGRPEKPPPATSGPARAREGTAETIDTPIDSGMPRCHWHRVRLQLYLPARTGVTISLVTVEDPSLPIAPGDWQHVDDPDAIRDFLIDQPPGRYLHLKIELRGDGIATPAIQRLRIDFPRSTSATRLPGVFREDPISADFLDRFVSLFDASIEDLDRLIATFPALLDPSSTPPEALAWIGTFLDIALDPAWSVETRRYILREAPELYRRRGTPWALSRAIQLTTGMAPAIQELASSGMFARVGKARTDRGFRIGEARLFGAARARMRLGASALGQAPLRSYGDPDRDHLAASGWRILVQLPGGGVRSTPDALDRLRRLVDTQKPAHVTAQIRIGGDLALVGTAMAVGIDTRLGGLPLPYLGRNTQLGRRTVLARGRARGGLRMAVGTAAAVAIQTVLL
jgi:phage tail-like protein